MSDAIRSFLREHGAAAVGATPPQPTLPPTDESDADKPGPETVDLAVECDPADWAAIPVGEAPTRPGEAPVRFIDGSHTGQPVLCIWSPQGCPIPLVLSEIGAVALRLKGRTFHREFATVERVLSFVADPFPWEEVEAFSQAMANDPRFAVQVLPAQRPATGMHPYDYEAARSVAYNTAQHAMRHLERLALAVDRSLPTLVDGPLDDVIGNPPADSPLLIGVVKLQAAAYLHDAGWRVLLRLKPGQRTPVFRIARPGSPVVATWYLKLAGGPRLAPNWGHVRVEIPWGQFTEQFGRDFGFVGRLSRWLIDARCRVESYARMPVSLDPIVRAEDVLKPLFTPFPVLANRLYRAAGLFRGDEG